LGKVAAEESGEPRRPVGSRRKPQQYPLIVADNDKGDRRIGHRQPAHHIDRELALGARRFQEFKARRSGEKQVANLDPCPVGRRCRHRTALGSGFDCDFPGGVGAGRAREEA
jgi:hypothetical protein